MVPFGGGILMGVALLWVLPEMAAFWNWPIAVAWVACGFALLWVMDRYIHPVCPSCSHAHEHMHGHHHGDHESAHDDMHGFGPPLLIAAGLHAAIDGWSVVAANGSVKLGEAFVLAVAVHKIPEGIALGAVARAALESRRSALWWTALAEMMTLAGAGLEIVLAPYLGDGILHVLLAVAGGAFVYLGGHPVYSEGKRRGLGAGLVPAVAGIAAVGVIKLMRWIG
jgi:zinc and cadmium transporter